MLLKKTAWFWKSGLAAISFMLIVSVSGCSDTPQEETAVVETISEVQLSGQKDEEETEKMIECCLELYEKAAEENNITKTALMIIGDAVTHSHYERSELYNPSFTTEFRQATKER